MSIPCKETYETNIYLKGICIIIIEQELKGQSAMVQGLFKSKATYFA